MTPKEAEQLRRAIDKLLTALLDCDYAALHEPHNVSKTQDHHERCARRLEALINRLTTNGPGKGE